MQHPYAWLKPPRPASRARQYAISSAPTRLRHMQFNVG
jgi:hypothetical protein